MNAAKLHWPVRLWEAQFKVQEVKAGERDPKVMDSRFSLTKVLPDLFGFVIPLIQPIN
jgi:hypothetical protein